MNCKNCGEEIERNNNVLLMNKLCLNCYKKKVASPIMWTESDMERKAKNEK